MKEVSLLFCLPDNPFFLEASGLEGHAVQEATYVCVFLSSGYLGHIGTGLSI
jgi:hypothetical protein